MDMFQKYNEDEYERVKPFLSLYTFIDPAISDKQEADDTAIVTIGIDSRSNNVYVIDCVAKRMQPDEIIDTVFAQYRRW